MKRIRGDKPIGVIEHTYMEIPQGTPCLATVISNKQKCHIFLFIFFLFSSTKSENRSVEQVLPGVRELIPVGMGKVMGKGGRRVNMVQKMCKHVSKCKNDTC
jgi:hypothetical protein